MNASGSFVVSWTSSENGGAICAREYDSSGEPAGNEYVVSGSKTGEARRSAVTIDSAGDFAVSWHGKGPAGIQEIFSQRYLAGSLPDSAPPEPTPAGALKVDSTSGQKHTLATHGRGAQPNIATVHRNTAIVFVDTSVPHWKTLLAGVRQAAPGDQIVLLDPTRDGVAQITDTLAGRTGITAIHLITHGNAGELQLGSVLLSAGDLDTYAASINAWRQSLASGADLLLYGCDVAEGSSGKAFVDAIANLSGAAVAASTDLTGQKALGGNWNLEYATGRIQTPIAMSRAVQRNWADTLLLLPPAATNDQYAVNKNQTLTVAAPGVLSNDTDFLNSPLTAILQTNPAHGTLVWDPAKQGGFTYTPTSGYTGTDSFTYKATDGVLTSSAATVTITVNAPPTVATPAAAAPNNVNGTATALSVLGADDGGASNLTYTWSTTGTPPAAVNFSSNGTNASKNATATFSKAGSYVFQVTVTDAGGLSTTSSVNVMVHQTATLVVVAPANATVPANDLQQFTGTVQDQFGDAVSPQPGINYSLTGPGTLSNSGLYLAPSTTGTGTVTATAGPLSGSRPFTIGAAGPVSTPLGGETLVNTASTGGNQQLPAVAMDDSGNFIVVWEDGAAGGEVNAQLYNASGTAVGSQFQVNTLQAGGSPAPSVAMNTSGQFVVSWNGNGNSVYAKVFNAAGTALTGDTLVSSARQGNTPSAVAMAADGSFTIVYEGNRAGDNDGIYAQRFTAAGAANGGAVLMNATVTGPQTNPAIATDPQGGSVVTWTDKNPAQTIKAALLPASGSPSAEILVGASGGNNQDLSAVGIDDSGNFVVAWSESGPGQGIYTRRYNAAGTALDASPVQLSDPGAAMETKPAIAVRADGSYLVAWTAGNNLDGNGNGVFGQAFKADGSANGGQFLVNTTTQGNQQDAAIAWYDAHAVVAWDGQGAGDNNGVFFQLYATPAVAQVAYTPTASPAATNENTPTTSGLVITPNALNSSLSGYFQITGITGGSLSDNNGNPISNGQFITFASGEAGLVFNPTTNSTVAGMFDIQASTSNSASGLGGSVVADSIVVKPVPLLVSPTNATANEDTSLVFSAAHGNAISVSDPGNSGGTASVTLTASNGTLILASATGLTFSSGSFSGSSSDAFSGTFAHLNAALSGLQFVPGTHYSGSASLAISVSEGSNAVNGSVAITVDQAAHTPSVTTASTNENVQSTSGLVITPNSLDTSIPGYFQITGIAGGSLSDSNGNLISDGQFITFAAGEAGLLFNPATNSTAAGLFSVQASTSNSASGLGGSIVAATITIRPVPSLAAPATGTTAEDAPLVFSAGNSDAISVSDPGNANGNASVTLTATNGTLTLASVSGISFTSGTASGAASLTFTGTLTSLNNAMNGLQFVPATHYVGSASLAASVSEGVNSANATIALAITAVAHTPSITNAKTVINQETSSGLVIARNAIDGPVVSYFQITGITGGTLFDQNGNAILNGDFVTAAQGSAGLRFMPTNGSLATGTFHVQASTANNPAGLGGSLATASITVAGPPVNQVPVAQTIAEDAPLIFSSTRLISVNDGSIGSGTDLVTLSASNGAVTLAAGSGVTLTSGTGIGDSSVSFTGTLAKLRAALNGLIFTPALHYAGAASLQIVTADPANVGPSGALSDTDSVSITVDRIAHQPSVSPAQTIETAQTTSGLAITPNALDASLAGYFKITGITGGSLALSDGSAVAGGDFIPFAEGEAGLKFTPVAGSAPTGSFQVQASTTSDDSGLGGSVVTATVSVARKQTLAVDSGALAYTEGQGAAEISPGLTITDQNAAPLTGATVRVIGFVPSEDTLQFTDQNGIAGSWDAANGVLTLSGAASATTYQSALQSVAYANSSHDPSVAARSAEFSVVDVFISSDPVDRPIDVVAVNDAPAISGPPAQSTVEDVPLGLSPAGGDGITLADVDSENHPEQLTLSATDGTLATSSSSNSPASAITLTGTLSSLDAALDGLIFTPALHYSGPATLAVTLNDLGNTGVPGPQSATMTIAVDVTPIAHTPSVTDTQVLEGHRTSTGLVITPDVADGSLAGYFKITNIAGGSLVQQNGVTPIGDGDFITFAQGLAGLRFTPTAGSVAPGAFTIQASVSPSDSGLGGSPVQAAVTVIPAPLLVRRSSLDLPNQGPAPITTDSLYVAEPTGAAEGVSYVILSLPQHGTLLLDGTPLSVNGSFTRDDLDSGAVSYAPAGGVPFPDTFQFEAQDAVGRTTGAVAFQLKRQAVPIAPAPSPAPPVVPTVAPASAPNQNSKLSDSIVAKTTTNDSDSTSATGDDGKSAPAPDSTDVSPPASKTPGATPAAAPAARPVPRAAANAAQRAAAAPPVVPPTPARDDSAVNLLHRESMRAEFASTRKLLANNSKLWVDLDAMKQNMHSEVKVWAGTASFMSIGMSLAYFVWIFRAGSLLSSLLSSMPAWNFVDPLPILESIGSGRHRNNDDEGLEGLVNGNRKKS